MFWKLKNEADIIANFFVSTCAVTIGLNLSWPSTEEEPRELNTKIVGLYPAAIYWAQLSSAIVHFAGPYGVIVFGVGASTCAAAVMSAFPCHVASLFVGRALQGFGCASLAVALPNYMADSAKGLYQSAMLCLIEVFTLVGILISQALSIFATRDKMNYAMTGIMSLNMIVVIVLHYRCNRWLSKTRHDRSGTDTKCLLQHCDFGQIKTASTPCLLANKEHIVIIVICLVLLVFRDFTGVNMIKMNIQHIIGELNIVAISNKLCTLMITTLQLVFTLATTLLVEVYSKRKLLLISTLGTLLSMTILLLVIWNYDKFDHFAFAIITLCLLLLYVVFFTQGLGTVIWAVQFEIVNHKVRKFATGVMVSTHFLFLMIAELMDFNEISIYSKCSKTAIWFIFIDILQILIVDHFISKKETKKTCTYDSEV